ncbi:fasciclin domain-containing protein [Niabella sp. CC-SYL272]|uniref:fasciclin domain-containing protein n=1 Tax=Niabella agricola TaxID=2891571 RepID=UPI001F45AD8F|nr:fasciclin domain-containing protein [Niabella agricola]MCF3107926.1 fasciclin domain-containing protein [Niabella agricola]
MKRVLIITIICTGLILLASCKRDDYLTGGSLHNPKFDMTTYDFLKNRPDGLFDTLVSLIDKAGLKDLLNKNNITFFAPTDYSILKYLDSRTKQEQKINENRKWTLDSMIKYELTKFSDSLKTYIVDRKLAYSGLTNNGTMMPTEKAGSQTVVSYEEIKPDHPDYEKLGGNTNVSTNPFIVYYTLLYAPLTPPIVAADITPEQGRRERVQTSGIETNTGMIQVLNNDHILFFRQP